MLEFYLDMLDVKASLDKSYRDPSPKSLDAIFAYSRNSSTNPKRQSASIK
ncbi:hypothetical protein [Pseudarcicella hirudinis]|nr:hypothetical protein [Pseudarcicella hirudinis]